MKIIFCFEKPDNLSTGGVRQISDVIRYFNRLDIPIEFLHSRLIFRGIINDVLSNFWYVSKFLRVKGENIIIVEDYSKRCSFFLFNNLISFFRPKFRLVGIVQAFYFNYRTSVLKNFVDRLVSYFFLKNLDVIVTSGKAAENELVKLRVPVDKIRNVYLATREEFAKNLEIKFGHNKSRKILFIGRLHPVKGVEYLIEAIGILKKRELKLTIVGDFKQNAQYSKKIFDKVKELQIADKVEFAGRVEDDYRLAQFYKSSDVLILPSLWDTSPITLVEAMCFGLAIVATRVGGIPEYVENGVNGILVPPKSSQALAEAISLLIDNYDLRKKLSRGSFERSFRNRNRTWEVVGKEYYEIFSKLWMRQGRNG